MLGIEQLYLAQPNIFVCCFWFLPFDCWQLFCFLLLLLFCLWRLFCLYRKFDNISNFEYYSLILWPFWFCKYSFFGYYFDFGGNLLLCHFIVSRYPLHLTSHWTLTLDPWTSTIDHCPQQQQWNVFSPVSLRPLGNSVVVTFWLRKVWLEVSSKRKRGGMVNSGTKDSHSLLWFVQLINWYKFV